MPITVTAAVTAKARLPNSSSLSSGALTRASTAMKIARNTAATQKATITWVAAQPYEEAWITANSSANMPIAIDTCPGQSSERPSGDEELFASSAETTKLSAANPATAANAQCQLAFGSEPKEAVASAPPITGETKPPLDSAAAQIDMPRPRLRAVCVPAATIASDVGNSAAAPIPASAWPAQRTMTRVSCAVPGPGVSTAITSPATISATPTNSSRLRPNMSP